MGDLFDGDGGIGFPSVRQLTAKDSPQTLRHHMYQHLNDRQNVWKNQTDKTHDMGGPPKTYADHRHDQDASTNKCVVCFWEKGLWSFAIPRFCFPLFSETFLFSSGENGFFAHVTDGQLPKQSKLAGEYIRIPTFPDVTTNDGIHF